MNQDLLQGLSALLNKPPRRPDEDFITPEKMNSTAAAVQRQYDLESGWAKAKAQRAEAMLTEAQTEQDAAQAKWVQGMLAAYPNRPTDIFRTRNLEPGIYTVAFLKAEALEREKAEKDKPTPPDWVEELAGKAD